MAKVYKLKKKKQPSKSKIVEINNSISSTFSLLFSLCLFKKDIEMEEIDKIPPIYIGRKRNYIQSLSKKEIKEKNQNQN